MNDLVSLMGEPAAPGLPALSATALSAVIAGVIAFGVAAALSHFLATGKILPDHPNARSSHVKVTSRAGGVAIFAGWAASLAAIAVLADGAGAVWFAWFGGLAGFIFLIGLADDRFTLPALFKLVGQFVVAIAFIVVFGALERFAVPFLGEIELGWWGAPLTVLWIVGFMNVFNFMDGVNGLAATAAIFFLSVFAVIAASFGAPLLGVVALMLALSTLGFLPANFAQGRLFMGDSGSLMLSFMIAALSVMGANATFGGFSMWFAPIAMAPFLFDVAVTFTRRLIRQENVLNAHREHLYQLMAQMGASHGRVTAVYLTFIAISSTAAIVMLRVQSPLQPLIFLAVCCALVVPARRIYRAAARAGVVAAPTSAASAQVADKEKQTPVRPEADTAESSYPRAAE